MQENRAAELIIVLALAITVLRLSKRLPWQNIVAIVVMIAGLSWIFEAVGARFGIPFGPFFYTENFSQRLFHQVPWPMPLLWVVVLVNARELARLLLRPWRETGNYGLWVLALASILAALFDAALEPFASGANHWWIWTSSKIWLTWYGAPWINFVGWAIVTFFILSIVSPWFLNKKVSATTKPDWILSLTWLGLMVLLGITDAYVRLWAAAGLVFAAVIIIALSLWFGWHYKNRYPILS